MFQNISADFSTHLSNLGLFLLHSAQSHSELKYQHVYSQTSIDLRLFFFTSAWDPGPSLSRPTCYFFITTLQVKIELSYQR